MKRFISLLSIALGAMLLTSCVRREIDPMDIQTVLVNVSQREWQYSDNDNNNYFSATVNMPEITKQVFERGLVKVYRAYNFGTSGASQVELPYVRPIETCIDEYNDTWAYYTETVDYEFTPGKITFFYTASDFYYEDDLSVIPDAMQFRCVVMY